MNSTGLAYVNLLPTGSEELEICHDMEIFEHTHSKQNVTIILHAPVT